jgi:hypothetical protein
MKSYYLYETPHALIDLGAQNILTDVVPESQRL